MGNAAAGMIVGVERQVNLTFKSQTDSKLEKRTKMQGAVKVRKRARSDRSNMDVDRQRCAGSRCRKVASFVGIRDVAGP